MMTYAELLDELKQLGPDQLQQNVTLYFWHVEEYFKYTAKATDGNEVLDKSHLVIVV